MVRERIKKKKKNISGNSGKGFLRIVYYFILISFFSVAFYILFFSPFLEITNVAIEGEEKISEALIQEELDSVISGKHFNVFPKSNFITFPEDEIVGKILHDFNNIRKVEVEKIFPVSVKLKIEEREAVISWCSSNGCFMVDEKGVVYSEANFESKEVSENNLIKISDMSNKEVNIGDEVINEKYIEFITVVGDFFRKDLNVNISNEYLMFSGVSESIRMKTDNGTNIDVSMITPIERTIRIFKTFINKNLGITMIREGDLDQLEYIDLRIENKVFYKFKNQEEKEEDSNEEDAGDKKDNEDKKKDKDKKDE